MDRHSDNSFLYILALLGTFIVIALFFSVNRHKQNAVKERRLASNLSEYDQARALARMRLDSPFKRDKLRLNLEGQPPQAIRNLISNARIATDDSNTIISSDADLVAVVDRDCIENLGRGSFRGSARLSEAAFRDFTSFRGVPDLRYVSVPFRMAHETSIQALRAEANSDICLIGIGADGEVRKSGLYDDPRSSDQKQNTTVEIEAAEDFYYNSSLAPNGDTVIAIVDTGIDYTHQDIESRMWRNPSGRMGYDFYNNDWDPYDDEGHGTHVAGLAAAAGGNDVGLSGMAAAGVRLMAVKVLGNTGSGSFSDVANGVRWAADNGADVINLSLSGQGSSSVITDAIVYALNSGAVVVVAVGNDSKRIDGQNFIVTPGSIAIGLDGVISVGSIDSESFRRSYFSNYGHQFVEIASPGSNGIFSTTRNNSYEAYQGTSMATPIVAGIVAQIIGALQSNQIIYTPSAVENLVKDYSRKIPILSDEFLDGNVINARRLSNAVYYRFIITSDAGLRNKL